ncbi:MAG: hypothetical protein O2840_01810 [bacterium]|nr:hypothetical protein [bacterium]
MINMPYNSAEAFTGGNPHDARLKERLDRRSQQQPEARPALTEKGEGLNYAELVSVTFSKISDPKERARAQAALALLRPTRRTSSTVLPEFRRKQIQQEIARMNAHAAELQQLGFAETDRERARLALEQLADTPDFLLRGVSGKEFLFGPRTEAVLWQLYRTAGALVLTLVLALLAGTGIAEAQEAKPVKTPVETTTPDTKDSEKSQAVAIGNGGGTNRAMNPSQSQTDARPITSTAAMRETGSTTETLSFDHLPVQVTLKITGTLYGPSGQRVGTILPGRVVTATEGIRVDESTGKVTIGLERGSYITATGQISNALGAISLGLGDLPGVVFDGREVRNKGEERLVQVRVTTPLNLRSTPEIAAGNLITGTDGKTIAAQGSFSATLVTKEETGDIWALVSLPTGEQGYVAVRADGQVFSQVGGEQGTGGPESIDWARIIARIAQALPELTGRLRVVFEPPSINIPTGAGLELPPEPTAMIVQTQPDDSSGQVIMAIQPTPEGLEITQLTSSEEIAAATRQALEEVGGAREIDYGDKKNYPLKVDAEPTLAYPGEIVGRSKDGDQEYVELYGILHGLEQKEFVDPESGELWVALGMKVAVPQDDGSWTTVFQPIWENLTDIPNDPDPFDDIEAYNFFAYYTTTEASISHGGSQAPERFKAVPPKIPGDAQAIADNKATLAALHAFLQKSIGSPIVVNVKIEQVGEPSTSPVRGQDARNRFTNMFLEQSTAKNQLVEGELGERDRFAFDGEGSSTLGILSVATFFKSQR